MIKKEHKYQFGGEENDLYSSNFFNTVANYLSNISKNQTPEYTFSMSEEPEVEDEDVEYEGDNSDYEDLKNRYDSLYAEYESLQQSFSNNLYTPEFNDSFLNFLFQPDTSNKPLAFSDEELYPVPKPATQPKTGLYQTASQYKGMKYGFGSNGNGKIDCSGYVCKVLNIPRTTSESILTGSSNFRKLTGNESLQEGSVVGFDLGSKSYDKGRKHGIDHVGVVIRNPDTGELELSESTSGKGVINRPLKEALEQYQKKAKSVYVGEYQLGGKVATTPEDLYIGLNDSTYTSMLLNLPKQYNIIRGLDSGEPVYVQDELGKSDVLYGPKDISPMYGKVKEKKLGGNYIIDKPCNC